MGLRQALPVQPPSAAEAASVAALLQSRPTPYRTRGPITVGRSCQQGPWELQLDRDRRSGGDQIGGGQQVVARDPRTAVDEPPQAGTSTPDVPPQDVAVLDERLAGKEPLGFRTVVVHAEV